MLSSYWETCKLEYCVYFEVNIYNYYMAWVKRAKYVHLSLSLLDYYNINYLPSVETRIQVLRNALTASARLSCLRLFVW